MVRDNRIKNVIFPSFTVNGSLLADNYTQAPINGEILKIVFQNITSPGSFWLAESGTNIEIWRRNNITSGLANFNSYPFMYAVDITNTTGSPYSFVNMVTANPLYLAGSGLTSGTSKSFGPVTVFYR